MVYGFIYKIEIPSNDGTIWNYIGQTTRQLEQREEEHRKCAKRSEKWRRKNEVHKAIKQYDMVDTFTLTKICNANTKKELDKKEIEYIKKYDSLWYYGGHGFNMTLGGSGVRTLK